MTGLPTEVVIAGSKAFALALLAPLTVRVGTRPRIAGDPAQALKLMEGSGLVVVEFQGDRSLAAIRQLLDQAAGLSVVVAVPDALAGAGEALRSLGVEAARWDGKPDEVLSAVSRHLAGARTAGSTVLPAQASVARAAPAVPPAGAAPSRVGDLFDDISLDDAPAVEGPAQGAAPRLGSAPAVSSAPAGGAWPSALPTAVEAADALGQGLQGVFAAEGSPFAVVAEVMAGMSPLERAVLVGTPQPVDVEPIRRAAVMRVRVAVGLATAPSGAPAPVDTAAVSTLLAEIDGLLSEVNGLVSSAPPDLQPSLELVRNALVREAIDFSEAAHRAATAEAPAAEHAAGITTAAERKAAQTRVIAIATPAEKAVEAAEARRRTRMLAVLGVAVALAAAFHGYRWLQGRAVARGAAPLTRAGAPADALVLQATGPGAPVLVRSGNDRPFTAEELKRMEDEEALRGNSIRQVGPSAVLIIPAQASTSAPPAPGPGR